MEKRLTLLPSKLTVATLSKLRQDTFITEVNLAKFQTTVKIENGNTTAELLGVYDENLNIISQQTSTVCFVDDGGIIITGEEVDVRLAEKIISKLIDIIALGEKINKTSVNYCIELAKNGSVDGLEKIVSGVVAVTSRGKQIKCKTVGQKKYVDAINKNTIVFGVGPAGTGKTYLAVAIAVTAYKNKEIT